MATLSYNPTDYTAEAAQIDRARKMAEAMQLQGMQPMSPGGMAGQVYVAPSWTQGLAKLAQSYFGGQGVRQADEQQKALAGRAQTDAGEWAAKISQAMQGTPEQVGASDGEGFQVQAAQPPSRAEQIALAMQGTQNPLTSGASSAILQSLLKQNDPYNLRQGEVRMGPNNQVLARNDAPRKLEVNPTTGRAYDPTALTPGEQVGMPKAETRDRYDGERVIQEERQPDGSWRQIGQGPRFNPNPQASVKIENIGPREFDKELAGLDAKELGKMRDGAQTANSQLQTVANMRAALQKGVYSGGGAQAKTAAANFINGLTGVTPKNLPGSQLFNAEASKLVLDSIKLLGANPSNADRDFIEKTIPTLSTSPEARESLLAFMEQKAQRSIELYKRADEYARKNRTLGGFDLVPPPTAQTAPTATTGAQKPPGMSDADWQELQELRARFGGK